MSARSSQNEGDARFFARMLEVPMVEPAYFQEAKDLTKWALELSEELKTPVILRSVTRLSHASGNVKLGPLPPPPTTAKFEHRGPLLDFMKGPMITGAVVYAHSLIQGKAAKAAEHFESAPFNTYEGPESPERPPRADAPTWRYRIVRSVELPRPVPLGPTRLLTARHFCCAGRRKKRAALREYAARAAVNASSGALPQAGNQA